jgi:CRISPR system Cascade subunit CasA
MEVIEPYLASCEERFLSVPSRTPVYQVAALRDRDDKFGPFEAPKLQRRLAESDHKVRLFPQRTGERKNSLHYAEAARWLLHVNAFSETFGKLEAKGKLSKDSPSLGVGWLGKLGLIIAVGDNLFKTLMLNLVFLQDGMDKLWGNEKPIWEVKAVKATERTEITVPNNQSSF